MTIALFEHADTSSDIKPFLEQEITWLIEKNESITFLVGTHGNFQSVTRK